VKVLILPVRTKQKSLSLTPLALAMGALQKAWRFLKAGEWWDDQQKYDDAEAVNDIRFQRNSKTRNGIPLSGRGPASWGDRGDSEWRANQEKKLGIAPGTWLDSNIQIWNRPDLVSQLPKGDCPTCQGPMGDLDGHQSGSCNNCVMRQGANPAPEYNRENAALPPPTNQQ
jgi:hypothetical protein